MTMNEILLIFFAIPVAVIILSAIFETIINCPLKIAGIVFSIFLIVAFATIGSIGLVADIVYTIFSYITALLVKKISRLEINNESIGDFIYNNSGNEINDLYKENNNQIVNNNIDNFNTLNSCRYNKYRKY